MNPGPASPASPGSPTAARPGARTRGISFRSDRSGGSKTRNEPLVESPRERDRKSLLWAGKTKANPNAALEENQPAERSHQEASTLQNLRDMDHKDQNGQPIVEPDLSNPTRPRFERPLDTIRSFEKAIDNGYRRRSSYAKQDSAEQYDQNNQYASRRSSYFGGLDNTNSQQRPSPNGPPGSGSYYGPPSQGRPDSAYMANNRSPQQQQSQQQQRYPNGAQQQQQRPYQQHTHHQSHDTVNTGGTYASDSTGPWANSTDPSSENSSIDRNMSNPNMMGAGMKPGMEGYGGPTGPIMEEQGYGDNGYGGGYGYNQNYPQQQQQQQQYGGYNNGKQQNGASAGAGPAPAARRPIPLGNSGAGEYSQGGSLPSMARGATSPGGGDDEGKKGNRKSWLKKRFSKG